jgi:hypothetical protein
MSSFVICLGLIHDQHQHQQEQQELGKRVSVIWFRIHSRRTEERENPSFLPSFLPFFELMDLLLMMNNFLLSITRLRSLRETIFPFIQIS